MERLSSAGNPAELIRTRGRPGGGHLTTPLAPRPAFPASQRDVAAALAAAVPALGVRRTAEELTAIASGVALCDAPSTLPIWLEQVAGREVADDELLVAREAFTDHLSASNEGKR